MNETSLTLSPDGKTLSDPGVSLAPPNRVATVNRSGRVALANARCPDSVDAVHGIESKRRGVSTAKCGRR